MNLQTDVLTCGLDMLAVSTAVHRKTNSSDMTVLVPVIQMKCGYPEAMHISEGRGSSGPCSQCQRH